MEIGPDSRFERRKQKFNELGREADISPRILSKELQEMEMDGLVNREVCDTKPVTVQYSLTEYADTLNEVLFAMEKWGYSHRQHNTSGDL
ncbi:hypothetical protein GCM10023149_29620 [Mucilaginibacter gynuensis]|uniref:HTH hxlR-type domain-containing protein n=1 Tax=Mucilaginibacter gynuensis TaxID=1302236 RepID=A0ABP8GMI9_9SPHI